MAGEAGLSAPRRYLCLYLPRWATDCLKRADPELAASSRPFALWEKQKGAMKLVALDDRAGAEGLFIGQNVTDARALVANLELREIDRGYVEQKFAEFADWHSNASPLVSILSDQAPWGDLVLDITGVEHLFGGEHAMLDMLVQRLSALGIAAVGAVAPTIGLAWALAHCTQQRVVEYDEVSAALAGLPVAALRLHSDQVERLKHLGLKQIGQLYNRDRRSLRARFGAPLLLRLDQALGHIEEQFVPRLPATEHFSERHFADPIGLIDDVLMTARDLAFRLASKLEAEALGAQTFHLFLYRVDHKVMTLSVNAASPTRDATHIARLFAYRAERLSGEYEAGFGIDLIRLGASSTSPISEQQLGAFDAEDGTSSVIELYDRMTSRLGALGVVRHSFVDSHVPERAVRLEPVIAAPIKAKPLPPIRAPRPLRLLPQPEPIEAAFAQIPDGAPPSMIWRRVHYRFVRSSGPERLRAEWSLAHKKLMLTEETANAAKAAKQLEQYYGEGRNTRDYFIAEDEAGRRFWIFREGLFEVTATPKWFLHGFFA